MAIDKTKPFIGFHTRIGAHEAVDELFRLAETALIPLGFNTLVLEFNPGFKYKCFPEYSTGTIDVADAKRIKAFCDEKGLKAIPLFQCLSHQSDNQGGIPWPLLKENPEFMETPEFINGGEWPDFYVHSWCASNDRIYDYVFPMMDEIIDAFEADVVHIGIDEVFDIGVCPRCKGKDKAALLADTVKKIHDHLAERGIETMMWGDRLLSKEEMGYTMWDSDILGTYPAFDMEDKVTRDIVITDWHYDMHSHGYPSTGKFMEAGFNTIISVAANRDQPEHFFKHALEYVYLSRQRNWKGKMLGVLCTQWNPLTKEVVDLILAGVDGTAEPAENPWIPSETGSVLRRMSKKFPTLYK